MTESVVVEGYARLRDGKKWKTRWLVLRKPSPVADCLVLLVFKDKSDKAEGNKERATVTLEDICGLETGQCYEDVAFTLVILCLNQAALLGFDSRDNLQAWEGHLRYSLGEVHRFNVGVLAGTKLESGPATLHLCNNLLALVRDVPPVVIGHWNLPDLRRYGPVPNGFVFEGGTRCGYWSGVFLLTSSESEQISFLFDCIVREISPTRVPFGLMPILPDPGTSQTNFEEKLNHETQELEKRLSMLSNQNSMVYSTFSSDDRSISGSSDTSDTSQMDSSISSRLAIWTELPMAKISGNHPKVVSVEKLSANQGDGHNLDAKAPRQLQEIGRQSSSDSGIATGSHISYSGSLSSYTGSLDICEDFGSVFSLPPHLAQDMSPCCCAKGPEGEYKVPTSLRYLYDTPRNLIQGKGGQTVDTNHQSPLTESLKGVISKTPLVCSHRSSGESGMKRNDTESCHLFSSLTSKTIVTICATCGGFQGTPPLIINLASGAMLPAVPADRNVEKLSPPSSDRPSCEEPLMPKKGREKLASLFNELLRYPKEWKSNRRNLYEVMVPAPLYPHPITQPPGNCASTVIYEDCFKCLKARCHSPQKGPPLGLKWSGKIFSDLQSFLTGLQLTKSSEDEDAKTLPGSQMVVGGQNPDEDQNGQALHSDVSWPCVKEEGRRADPAYEIMGTNSERDENNKCKLMVNCGPQMLLQESEGTTFPMEASPAERPRSAAVTYVNIPVSPTSKKQLNYMELELQEHSARRSAPRKSSTKYAYIDITATEAAHVVGIQHALGRQEGLHTLELRRKGLPH
ncbi:protein Dok-7-like isoform X3 [Nerophis ophidion]|uniref:protein Dok-7-like isoform X3 n=1 Tax=Nerophis ophidion TaxID=159077 RepID=UPI002AE0AAF4|nr:protein Dok-7-like isoform X3 [Nerophis ophidion]